MELFLTITFYIAYFALGFAVVYLACKLLNKIPARWLCDYDEQPTEELLGVRYRYNKRAIALSVILGLAFDLLYYTYGSLTGLCGFFTLLFILLVLIALADGKYAIIPDQFTAALAVLGVLFSVYSLLYEPYISLRWHDIGGWLSPVFGAVFGGGVLMLLNLIGKLLFKKESIGFGDIKLFAALGLFAGLRSMFIITVLTIFTAFFHFVFLLLFRKAKTDSYMPLGPYICIATVLFVLFDKTIMDVIIWYMLLIGL